MAKKKNGTTEFTKRDTIMIIGIVVACALFAVLVMVIGQQVRKKDVPKPSDTETLEQRGWHDFSKYFSKGMDQNGKISGSDVLKAVELCDYRSIEIPEKEEPKAYVQKYLLENCKVQDREELRKDIEERLRFYAKYMYEYNEENYMNYNGEYQFSDIYEAYHTTEAEFEKYMKDESAKQMRLWLILEAIYEKEGLSSGKAEILDWIRGEGLEAGDKEGVLYQHGEAYTNMMGRQQAVWNLLLNK